MKRIISILLALTPCVVFSQFTENFSDGSFQSVPPAPRTVNWVGDAENFIVNSAFQLQLNAPTNGSPSQLGTASSLSANTLWEWWIKYDFNPTSSNYAKVFLCSDESNLTGSLNGLFVRIGYTNKNVCLISQKGNTTKILIDGIAQRLNKASVALHLQAKWDKYGTFSLYSKLDDEEEYVLEGSCSLTDVFSGSYFGMACYFSSTRSKSFYFDDFSVRELTDDEQGEDNGNGDEDKASENDIVINEILFNPPTGGDEYVEIYNRSDKAFDLRFISIATRRPSDGSLNTQYKLASTPLLLQPQEYLVITKTKDLVCSFFECRSFSSFVELNIMPALANASGCIVLINNQSNEIIDEFAYTEKMHTAGISNKRGISLERSNFDRPTSDEDNWYSASESSGFGTPGYQNSQYNPDTTTGIEEGISVTLPEINSDDYFINYRFNTNGYRCRAYVYDMLGRMVNVIANNELLGAEGKLIWNGKGSSGQTLSSGVYLIFMEVYDTKGVVKSFKKQTVVK